MPTPSAHGVDTRIRPLAHQDNEQVRLLWGENVLDDLEILSYDRWGPGIAVPVDTGVEEVRAATLDPQDGMVRLLEYLVDAKDAFCFVSADGDEIEGYIVASIHEQGVNDFKVGRIEELYVREDKRRQGIASRLVAAAQRELRSREVWQQKVEVGLKWTSGRRFWDAQRWEQDAVVYSLYD
jgi:GNAT superfamily N-acetyltransferase